MSLPTPVVEEVMSPPKDICVLTVHTCEYVTMHGKRIGRCIRVKDLNGDIIYENPTEPFILNRALGVNFFFL